MPVSLPVTPASMNYASVVFAGFAGISVLFYFVRGRKIFTGPPVPKDLDPDEGGTVGLEGRRVAIRDVACEIAVNRGSHDEKSIDREREKKV
jgi:hypothetical protein